jgi:replicative DNA helicase
VSAPVPGRVPPSDLDAEAAVLSAALLDPDSLLVASEILAPEHFYADANRRIYEAALALQAAGKPVDYVSVAGWLRDAGRLDQIGGTPYIALLSDCVPSVANVAPHAKRIREKYRLRQLIALCQRVEATGYGSDVGDVQAFIESTESQMYAISQDSVRMETGARVQDILAGCVADLHRKRRGEIPSGKLTPYKGLNRLLAGLKRGTVTTVAARPGMGKTSFVTELLVQGASDNSEATGGVMFSLEMPKDQIGNKLMAQWSLVDTRSIDTGIISGPDLVKVIDSANAIRQMPIIVDDKASITVTEIRSALRRHERALLPHRLGLVAIDYLQLMGFGDLPRGMNTNDQLEHAMRGLCAIAKDFNVPIVLLSQLNREVEKRADKRPNLGDLRSSGAIEQDSFNVIFLYREDQYRKPGEAKDNKGELIVAKARAGRSGTVNVEFIPKATKYVDTQEPADELDEWGASFDRQSDPHEPPNDWRDGR